MNSTSVQPCSPPGSLAVGLGCDRGVALATLETALQAALALCQQQVADIAVLASIELKRDEVALQALADKYAWPLLFYSASALAQVPVPNPSETVRRYTGTPAVAEAAAILAANGVMTDLLIEKYKFLGPDGKNATVSIARISSFSTQSKPYDVRDS